MVFSLCEPIMNFRYYFRSPRSINITKNTIASIKIPGVQFFYLTPCNFRKSL